MGVEISKNEDPLLNRTLTAAKELVGEFSVATYNILADCHVDVDINYNYWPKQCLLKKERISDRHRRLIDEIKYLNADILCLQEVDNWYHKELTEELSTLGYKSDFINKVFSTQEGVLTAFKTDRFKLNFHKKIILNDLIDETGDNIGASKDDIKKVERDSVALVTCLKCSKTDKAVLICNFHAIYDFPNPDVGALQVCLLAQKLKEIKDSLSVNRTEVKNLPVIFCGDFNAEPSFHEYKLLKEGKLSETELDKLRSVSYEINKENGSSLAVEKSDPGIAAVIFRNSYFNPLALKSSYETILGKEPDVTDNDGDHVGTLDYIFYTAELEVASILQTVPTKVFQPGEIFPSDHLSLKAEFCFK